MMHLLLPLLFSCCFISALYIFHAISLALRQIYDCPSTTETTMTDMAKCGGFKATTNCGMSSYFMGCTLVLSSMKSLYLNQCWLIINWIHRNTLAQYFPFKNVSWTCGLQNVGHFVSALMCYGNSHLLPGCNYWEHVFQPTICNSMIVMSNSPHCFVISFLKFKRRLLLLSIMLFKDWDQIPQIYCDLKKPYGDMDLGQHWLGLVAWQHQDIFWTDVDLSSVGSYAIHLNVVAREKLMKTIALIH